MLPSIVYSLMPFTFRKLPTEQLFLGELLSVSYTVQVILEVHNTRGSHMVQRVAAGNAIAFAVEQYPGICLPHLHSVPRIKLYLEANFLQDIRNQNHLPL